MDENTAASSGLARPSAFDADGMHSILEAAIGLTNLGAPVTTPQKPEPARKKPKMTTISKKKQDRDCPSSSLLRPTATLTRQNDCSATGALLPPAPGNRIMTQSQHPPPSHFATAVIHRPTPHPHLFPEYPNPPPPPSFTSKLRSNRHPDNLALPPKRQKVNQRSWTPPLEQPQAHQSRQRTQQTHYPTQPATSDIPAVEPSSASITHNFLEILYEIISDPSNQHVLMWLPHGRGFVIHDKQLFASQTLPQHFDGTKFASFTRRLKRWKFERVSCGPEMGAYYNKYFVRDRPDLVRGMTYGMEDDELLMEENDEQLNENKESHGEKKNKSEENKQSESVQANSLDADAILEVPVEVLCQADDDVLAAAMEVHRQQLRKLKRDMGEAMVMGNNEGQGVQIKKKEREKKKLQEKNESDTLTSFGAAYDDAMVEVVIEGHRQKLMLQQQQLFEESQNSHQEKYWQQQQQQTLPPSGKVRSSPDKLSTPTPTPYNPNDFNLPDRSKMTWINDTQVHQQQQSKRLQTQSYKESLGNSMPRPKWPPEQFQKPPSGSSMPLPKKPRYTSRQLPGKRKHQQQSQQQQRQMQHPLRQVTSNPEIQKLLSQCPALYMQSRQQQWMPQHHLRQDTFSPEIQQKMVSQGPALYNPGDYLSVSMARRNMAEMPMAGKMSKPRCNCNDIIPNTSSVDRDAILSQHCINIISPPDNAQQKCLNNIERQVLSEMSYPMLLTMTSSDSPSKNCPLERNINIRMNNRMNYNCDTMKDRMIDTTMLSDQDIRDTTTAKSSFTDTVQMNNHRFPANQEMTHKILASHKTHKEIMMMVARDLQRRAGGGQLATASQQQHHPLPPPRLQPQQQSRLSQEYLPMQQRHILSPQLRHPPMHAPFLPSRMQPHFQAPLSPSRTGYPVSHDTMLRDLEEKRRGRMKR